MQVLLQTSKQVVLFLWSTFALLVNCSSKRHKLATLPSLQECTKLTLILVDFAIEHATTAQAPYSKTASSIWIARLVTHRQEFNASNSIQPIILPTIA